MKRGPWAIQPHFSHRGSVSVWAGKVGTYVKNAVFIYFITTLLFLCHQLRLMLLNPYLQFR
eukprot:COSAG01_NODE_67812_length_266_cov_0.532934_1_plen_60_part_10